MVRSFFKDRFGVVIAGFTALACVAVAGEALAKNSHERPPKIGSASAIVISIPVGQILYEKAADEIRPIASLSKIMSAIVYMEQCKHVPLETLHEMNRENRFLAKGGDKSRLTTGWSFSHYDLLKAALMRSDNRALPALMDSCGMILQEFAMHMNLKATELGLKNTAFSEPNGLSQYNVSTAREYTKILLEATRYPVLREIMQTKKTQIIGWRKGKAHPIDVGNTDILVGRKGVDVVAGKTGYTDIARYCFGVLNRLVDNSTVAMVFLGSEGKHTRFGDFSRIHRWLNDRMAKYFADGGQDTDSGS